MSKARNVVWMVAVGRGRDYVTPEDVADAGRRYPAGWVQADTLEVLGCGWGAEDPALCAFAAWRGSECPDPERLDHDPDIQR